MLYPKYKNGSINYIVGPCPHPYSNGKFIIARITPETESGYNIIERDQDGYNTIEECQKECDKLNLEEFTQKEVEAIKTLVFLYR